MSYLKSIYLIDRLLHWADNEEMVDAHYTKHGQDCREAAEALSTAAALSKRSVTDTITVAGTSRFPMDMLRYDGAYPVGVDDVMNLELALDAGGRSHPLEINLHCERVTPERWRSFGWYVISHRAHFEWSKNNDDRNAIDESASA